MGSLREVLITVSNSKTPDIYLSRSYPDDDFDNNGKIEVYKTPVYKVFIKGSSDQGRSVINVWKALRFMPYWNDPNAPYSHYKTLKWVNAGLHHVAKKTVTSYNRNYGVQNTTSPYGGAIQISGSFLIHAGPCTLSEQHWGSAGCVEIVGDFDKFKEDIKNISGSSYVRSNDAISELVKERKLFVELEYALPPNFKSNFYGEY